MTFTDCWVTFEGLRSHKSRSNPKPFRKQLPISPKRHYWVRTVEEFAKARNIPIRYPLDNCTLEITLTGPQLREFLLTAYHADDPFVISASPYLGSERRYQVYADDF